MGSVLQPREVWDILQECEGYTEKVINDQSLLEQHEQQRLWASAGKCACAYFISKMDRQSTKKYGVCL